MFGFVEFVYKSTFTYSCTKNVSYSPKSLMSSKIFFMKCERHLYKDLPLFWKGYNMKVALYT